MAKSHPASQPSPAEVLAQRDRILSSKLFALSNRLKAFLSFIIDAELDDRSDRIKEFTLGIEVFEKDETFAPAWNNLGVVLMEQGNLGEAERVFRTAFALDNGQSEQIRDNLRLALAKLENPAYDAENNTNFALVRRGSGEYQLLATP